MANIIKIKRSTTAGNTPTLVDGEVAINQADMKLFTRNSSGVTKFIDFTSDAEKVAAGAIKTALDTKHGLNNTISQNATSTEQRTWNVTAASDRIIYQYVNVNNTGVYDSKDNVNIWGYNYAAKMFTITSGLTTNFLSISSANNAIGNITFRPGGDTSHTGYLEFYPGSSGSRHGYIGSSDGTNITIAAEVGKYNFTGNAPTIGGSAIFTAANMVSSGTADGTGYIPAGITP